MTWQGTATMNFLKALFLLCVIHVSLFAQQRQQLTPDQGIDGWVRNDVSGGLTYIVSLSPATAEILAKGGEADFLIPEFLRPFVTNVKVIVGVSPVDRNPPLEEMMKLYQDSKRNGVSLSMLDGKGPLESPYQQIDRTKNDADNLVAVSQNGFGGGFNTATSGNASIGSTNPALGGSASSFSMPSPSTSTRNNSTPLYPVQNTLDPYANSNSGVEFGNDPPSMLSNQNRAGTSTRLNDGFNAVNPRDSITRNSGNNGPTFPASYADNRLPNTGYGNTSYGSNTYGNAAGGYASTSNGGYRGAADALFANNDTRIPTSFPSQQPLASSVYDAQALQLARLEADTQYKTKIADLTRELDGYERANDEFAKANAVLKTENDTLQKSRDTLTFWQFITIALLVLCGYFFFWLKRCYDENRTLRANARNAFVNLGT
jgi:hypothetical protein